MYKLVTIVVLVCSSLITGCASLYTPSPDRPFEPIDEFTSSQSLTILNTQESTEEHKIGGRMLADYRAWTDVAIEIAERELKLRGMQFDPQAVRSLNLRITEARFETGWVTVSTEIDMDVVTGDGYTAKYTSRNSSAMIANPPRQVDGAMMRVVKKMLSDPKIVSYLTN